MVQVVVGIPGEKPQDLLLRAKNLMADFALSQRGEMATVIYGISEKAKQNLLADHASERLASEACDDAYLRTENIQSILARLKEDTNNKIIE